MELARNFFSEETNSDKSDDCDQSDEQCVLDEAGAFFIGYEAALKSRPHAKHFYFTSCMAG
jgi:hypothetical protein